MNINQFLQDCINDLLTIGIPVSKEIDPDVRIKKVTSYAGRCSGRKPHVITLSEYVLGNEDVLKDVVYHELIHTCPGCQNHGWKFKEYAYKINQIYQTNISTRMDVETFERIGMRDAYIRDAKYKISCPGCGQTIYRKRASELTKHPEHYRCGRCHGKLEVTTC